MSGNLQGNFVRGNFVLLRAGELRLIVPQADVGAASYIETGDTVASADCVALSTAMKVLPARPPERFIAAEFTGEYAGTAWCWDELRVLIDARLNPIPVPRALMSGDAPLQAYVEFEGELAFLTSAESICRYALAEQV